MMGQQYSIEIPNKSTFKLDEVCGLTGVKPYILRFWEAEFTQISPIESANGQKLYEHKDIEMVLLIKKLLFEDKLTIEKAKVEIVKHLMETPLADSDEISMTEKNIQDSNSIVLLESVNTERIEKVKLKLEDLIQRMEQAHF